MIAVRCADNPPVCNSDDFAQGGFEFALWGSLSTR